MRKMFRDFMVAAVVSFVYVLFSNPTESTAIVAVIALGVAGIFSLWSAIIRYVAEEYIAITNKSEKEAIEKLQTSLVVRDSVFAFAIIYGFMTRTLGAGLSLEQSIGYLIAASAPTMIVAVLSREIRIPFLSEYRKHDVVARCMEFNKVA